MSERVSLGHFIHIHGLSIGKWLGPGKYELYILYITSYISEDSHERTLECLSVKRLRRVGFLRDQLFDTSLKTNKYSVL